VVSQAIITTDLGGQISYWNRAAEELFGWKASEALGRDMVDLTIHSVTHDEKQQILNWLGSGGRWSGETQMRRRDGSTFLGQADDSPILDSQDRLVGIISITQDITARRAAEDALRKSNFMRDILSASLMNTPLALVFWKITHGQSEILDWNPAAEATFGWLREEVIGKSFALFLAPRAGAIQPASASDSWFANGPMPNRMQCQSFTHSGQALLMEWFNTSLSDLASNDDAVYILSLGENITERQLREEQLRASLQEKEILLREVYHRVKNNLMIMISLIDLQSANITDQNTLAILKDLQARVRTMALVHQSLYQSTSLSQVDFEGYLIALISYLSSLYNATHKVEITFAVENLSLRIETAIPCGLIINELVSNAYKYAFPEEFGEEAECRVHIGFNKIGEKYVLDVKDNGIGMPEGFDLANSPSLGIQMVYILTNQIDGTIELLPTQGTHFHITFAERAVAPLKGAGA
jgi:PAS domain S-box-containing protein